MSNSSKPQFAAVEYAFPQPDLPVVHCPICGKGTHDVHEDGSSDMTPCAHVAFIFLGEPCTFAYKSDDFDHRIDAKNSEDWSLENFQELLEKLEYDNKMLALEITHGGLSGNGGEIWYMDIYGFDYSVIG